MIFKNTPFKGSYIIELEKKNDNRGFFVRTFDLNEFKKNDIDFDIVQASVSYNKKKGIIRGIHYQDPYPENKLVQCITGSIWDVIIDIREDSDTYKKWFGIELDNNTMLYIPKGFAHGFQTLEDDTLILYYIGEYYHPECGKTIHWNSPEYDIKWKMKPSIISNKDNVPTI